MTAVKSVPPTLTNSSVISRVTVTPNGIPSPTRSYTCHICAGTPGYPMPELLTGPFLNIAPPPLGSVGLLFLAPHLDKETYGLKSHSAAFTGSFAGSCVWGQVSLLTPLAKPLRMSCTVFISGNEAGKAKTAVSAVSSCWKNSNSSIGIVTNKSQTGRPKGDKVAQYLFIFCLRESSR
jgi:hypothetical protein